MHAFPPFPRSRVRFPSSGWARHLRRLCLPVLLAGAAWAAPPDAEDLGLEPAHVLPPPLQVGGELNPDYARELEARLAALPAGDRKAFFQLLRRQQRSLNRFLEELEFNYRKAHALHGALDGESRALAFFRNLGGGGKP